jgi:HSP20 family protein
MPHMFREARDLADDVRRAFEDLERHAGVHGVSGECAPSVDVYETAEAIEVVMDLPGVPEDAVRVLVKQGTVLIVGEKTPTFCPASDATFHLVERGFGRFARAVRLPGAVDASRAEATLEDGELRLVLPRIEERRGREISVPIRRVGRGA